MTWKTLLCTAVTALALTACEEKDKTPPPAPVVDPIASPTPLTKVSVTGSAEFGAAITISGGAADVTATADRFTARWRAEVTLSPDKENALSVTATDAAGNTSEATVVKVVQAASKPTTLKLSLATSNAKAGELVGLVTRVLDQYGNELTDAAVTFETTPSLAASFTIPGSSPAVTKDQGVLTGTKQFVAYDLSAVAASGYAFQIKATAGTATDTQVLTVRPAAGQSFSKLAYVPSGTSLSLKAGEDASYSYEVVDLYGNVTTGPVSVFTNAPGAMVVDDGISGSGKVTRLTTVGAYAVNFYIAGVGQKGALTLNVGTAPGAFVDLSASATLTSPQSPVKVFARVRDGFGNVIGCTAGTTGDVVFAAQGNTSGAVTPGATTCFNGQFQTSFTFAAEDNYAITATYQPSGVNVSGNVFITVLNFDNTPPQVSIQNLQVNGTNCTLVTDAGVPTCGVTFGDVVDFDAVATDNSALAQVAYTIFFETSQRLSTRTVFVAANQASATVHFRFTVPNQGSGTPGQSAETPSLVAMAVDRAGNIMNSAATGIAIAQGAPVGNRVLTAVATGPLLNRPNDLAFDAAGNLFILNGNNTNVLRLASGGATAAVFATGVQGDFLVRGLAGANERLWVSDRASNNGIVRSFDPAATAPATASTFATISGGAGQASGLAMMTATPQRDWVDVTNAVDGDKVTVTQNAASVAYEFDSNAACTASASNVCVTIGATATAAQKATALAAAITGNTGSVVSATAASARVLLASKANGEPTGTTLVSLAKTGTLTLSAPNFAEGHDADLWVANVGDNALRRYLTTGGPWAAGTNHGAFTVGGAQWGLAVRDLWAAPTDALYDSVSYFVDGANQQSVRAYRTVVSGNGTTTTTSTTQLFSVNAGTGTPFNSLWDTAVSPTGCLLVSDEGAGIVYAIDTRNGTSTSPTVEQVARALPGPRGLAFDSAGNLFIAENAGNAVLKLTPTPDPTDCF